MFVSLRRAQSGLETIILIGGVVILSAASYFLFKGFLISSGGGTSLALTRSRDVATEDLLNLGLEPLVLTSMRWYSPASSLKTVFVLGNSADSPLGVEVGLEKSSFSGNGVDLDDFEIGFLDPVSGEYVVADFYDNGTYFVFSTPVIGASGPGDELEVFLFYNNSSPYTPITSFVYLINDSRVVFVSGSVVSEEKTDFSPPSVGALIVSNPSAGVGETISITVPLTESGEVSFVGLGLSGELEDSGDFLLPVLDSDEGEFGVWSVFSTDSGNGSIQILPDVGSGGDEVFVSLLVPEAGTFTVSIEAVDEWGNNGSGVYTLIVSSGGTVVGGFPVLSTLFVVPLFPEESEAVTFSLTATDEDGVSWCNLSVVDGGTVVDNQPMNSVGSEYSYVRASGFSVNTFTATVVCMNTAGNSSSVSASFTVTGPPPPSGTGLRVAFTVEYSGDPSIFSMNTTDGSTWSSETPSFPEPVTSFGPSLFQDSDNNYWLAFSGSPTDPLVARGWDGSFEFDFVSELGDPLEYLSLIRDSGGDLWIVGEASGGLVFLTSDAGYYWTLTSFFEPSPSDFFCPSLIQDSAGTYWVAYLNYTTSPEMYVRSSSDGYVWNDPVFLYDDPDAGGPALSLIQDSGGVYRLAYGNGSTNLIEIRSSSDGVSWSEGVSTPVSINWGEEGYCKTFSLAQDSEGTYWLAFISEDNDALMIASSLDLVYWSAPMTLSDSAPYFFDVSLMGDRGPPAPTSTSLLMAFDDDTGSAIWVADSSDGVSWSSPRVAVSGDHYGPSLVQDSSNNYWLAYDDCSGVCSILLSNSSDAVSWNFVTNVTESDGNPSLIQDSSGVFWLAHLNDSNIEVLNSSDGVSWTQVGVIYGGAGSLFFPSLIEDSSGNLRIAYLNDSGSSDIFVITSSDGGSTWVDETFVSTGYAPSLFQDSGGTFWLSFVDDDEMVIVASSSDGLVWDFPGFVGWVGHTSLVQDDSGVFWMSYTSNYEDLTGVVRSFDGVLWSGPNVIDHPDHSYSASIIVDRS